MHAEATNPVEPLLSKLQENFEKGRNKEIAAMCPRCAPFLDDFNNRVVDLMVPFKDDWFVDKDFFGRASIKNVLPVLVPELSYKQLTLQDGTAAQRERMDVVLRGQRPDMLSTVLDDLVLPSPGQ